MLKYLPYLWYILKLKPNKVQECYMLTLLTNMPKDVLVAQIYDGLVLLVLGMGTVFIFLVILIFASKLMSKIIMNMEGNRREESASAAPVQAASVQVQQRAAAAPQGDDAAVAAAIAAAYDKSRN